MNPLLIGGGVVALLIVILIVMYNGMVAKKNEVEKAFASMDTMLKKRFDLIPNLVATVRQYMQHEADTLVKVTQARGQGAASRVEMENELTKTIGGIMVAVEAYPELKASSNFRDLQASLNEIEEQLSASRRFYNSAVTDLNNAIQMFPSSIVAGMMHLTPRTLFSIPEAERQNPNVRALFQ